MLDIGTYGQTLLIRVGDISIEWLVIGQREAELH